ncbi:MAG: hypothetical protein KAS40_06135 [Desulfobacterales bacterium]|nr:hypothetical protein [Desulfobacterales bacterium]
MMAVYFVSGSRLGFGAALFSTGGNLGFALGPVVGSFLVLGFGLHATLGLLAGASGAALLASFAVTIVVAQELMPHYVGLASGLILGLGFGAGGLGTAFSGFLADKIGLYQVFWILALAPVLGAVLAVFIRTARTEKQKI